MSVPVDALLHGLQDQIPGARMTQMFFSSDSPKNLPPVSAAADSGRGSDIPSPRVLVVDDEMLIADTIVQILNRNGFIATAAYSGEQAIEIARLTCPELVLSDVLMGQVDGVEAAIQISRLCPETRIVLFSGQAATLEILSRAKDRGYTFELLPKPIHPTQLIRHLRT
jgi:CheY-like chemotaxis protein